MPGSHCGLTISPLSRHQAENTPGPKLFQPNSRTGASGPDGTAGCPLRLEKGLADLEFLLLADRGYQGRLYLAILLQMYRGRTDS
jgi:hypothetical protein